MLIQPLTPEILEKRRNFRRKILGLPGRFWRKTRRGILWMLAIGFVAHSALNIYASALLNRELAAIRQKGEPLQFAELAPPAVPNSQNAALVYAQAWKSLHFSPAERRAFNTRESQRTPQQQQIIATALHKNQMALNLARRASGMPKCAFPLDYNTKNQMTVLFPYYEEMRELARLMSAQAEIEAKRGDSAAALADVRAIFGMANHLSNEPILIGFLVAQAVNSMAHQSLAQVLESVPMTPTQASSFQESLPKTDWNRAFLRGLTGERAADIFAFELTRGNIQAVAEINALWGGNDAADGDRTTPAWVYYLMLLAWRPASKLDEVQNLRLWRKQLDAAANPQIFDFSRFNQTFDKSIEKLPLYAIMTRILMPVFSRVGDSRDRAEVWHRQREIALALAVYRTRKGTYPAQLSQIAALRGTALPLDPYSNKPFVYRREGKSFLLYSVGLNRRDDSGKIRYWTTDQIDPNIDDIVWGGSRR